MDPTASELGEGKSLFQSNTISLRGSSPVPFGLHHCLTLFLTARAEFFLGIEMASGDGGEGCGEPEVVSVELPAPTGWKKTVRSFPWFCVFDFSSSVWFLFSLHRFVLFLCIKDYGLALVVLSLVRFSLIFSIQ